MLLTSVVNAGFVLARELHTTEVADGASSTILGEELGPDVILVLEPSLAALAFMISEALLVLEESLAVCALTSSAAQSQCELGEVLLRLLPQPEISVHLQHHLIHDLLVVRSRTPL